MLKWIRANVWFALLLVVALVMRLYLWRKTPVTLYGDMLRYNMMAEHLVQHGYLGFGAVPDAFVTPGYPLFVALLFGLVGLFHGQALSHVRLVHEVFFFQQLLSLVSLWLVYRIGCQLRGRVVGWLAALLSLLYLQNGFIGLMLLTEVLFMPLLLATLSAVLYAHKSHKGWAYVLSGLLLGLTTLVRPTVLPLWAVFIALDWWQRARARVSPSVTAGADQIAGSLTAGSWQRGVWRAALLLTAGLVIALLPWWIRNLIDFHHFILLDNEAGNPLLAGADPYFQVPINTLIGMSRALHESQETFAIHYALTGLKEHFLLFAGWYLFGKLPYLLWTPWLYNYIATFVLFHRILVIIGGLCMLGLLGASEVRVVAWTVLVMLLLQMVFLPTLRYGYPIVALWIILVPVAGDILWQRYKRVREVRA